MSMFVQQNRNNHNLEPRTEALPVEETKPYQIKKMQS